MLLPWSNRSKRCSQNRKLKEQSDLGLHRLSFCLHSVEQIRRVFGDNLGIILLISPQKRRGDAYEHPQHMFLWWWWFEFNVPLTSRSWRRNLDLESHPKDWRGGGSNQGPLDCKASMLTTAPWPLLCFYGELTKIILELSSNEPAHEIMVLYCIGDQWRLRRACAFAQSRQSLRCLHTWTMEVKKGQTKNQTSSLTGWLLMRIWRMNLRRTKSAKISWVGSNTLLICSNLRITAISLGDRIFQMFTVKRVLSIKKQSQLMSCYIWCPNVTWTAKFQKWTRMRFEVARREACIRFSCTCLMLLCRGNIVQLANWKCAVNSLVRKKRFHKSAEKMSCIHRKSIETSESELSIT